MTASNLNADVKVAEAMRRRLDEQGDKLYEELLVAFGANKELWSKVYGSREYAVLLYRSLCNTEWVHFRHKGGDNYAALSFRVAAALVAELRNSYEDRYDPPSEYSPRDPRESYMAFYCMGSEGTLDPEVVSDLASLGFTGRLVDLGEKERQFKRMRRAFFVDEQQQQLQE